MLFSYLHLSLVVSFLQDTSSSSSSFSMAWQPKPGRGPFNSSPPDTTIHRWSPLSSYIQQQWGVPLDIFPSQSCSFHLSSSMEFPSTTLLGILELPSRTISLAHYDLFASSLLTKIRFSLSSFPISLSLVCIVIRAISHKRVWKVNGSL